MNSSARRRPNALKHGAYSRVALFPWEDETEYEKLERELREEWDPNGAFEEDAVFTILTCIWRKRRIREKRNFDVLAALEAPDLEVFARQPPPFFEEGLDLTKYQLSNKGPSYARGTVDDVHQLLGFSASLYGRLDGKHLSVSISLIGGKISEELKREFPQENFPSSIEWVRAIKTYVDNVMLPAARARAGSGNAAAGKAAEFLTTDRVLEDLAAEERLDAMIDRAIRRLSQAKMLKQMAGLQRQKPSSDHPPKQIEAGSAQPKKRRPKKRST